VPYVAHSSKEQVTFLCAIKASFSVQSFSQSCDSVARLVILGMFLIKNVLEVGANYAKRRGKT